MVTSSFLTEIKIDNDVDAEQLVSAIEKAEKNAVRGNDAGRPYSDASREEIRVYFLGNQ